MGELAEQYLYTDTNTCFIKMGMLAEHIVKYMLAYDGIAEPERDNTHAGRIHVLRRNDLLPREIDNILYVLRKTRNDAAHAGMESFDKAKDNLVLTYDLASWFMQTYGDYAYEPAGFVMPENIVVDVARLEKKSREQEAYIDTLKKELAELKKNGKVSAERREKARENAIKYPLSEHDTRVIIDKQLREAGWEADTDHIRQPKGAKPEKGHNKAIAEWKTESATGKGGYVDYALFVGERMVGIIEAKRAHKDVSSVLDGQCKEYASHIKKEDQEKYCIRKFGKYHVPFLYATNGRPYIKQFETKSGIWELDVRHGAAPKALQGWKSPEGIMAELERDIEEATHTLESTDYSALQDERGLNLRYYQIEAIQAVERALAEGKREILLSMATGTGKTRTVLGMIYRFLKAGRFRRVLFLVDRTALGEQAWDTFKEVKLEELMSLDKIYNVKAMENKEFDTETRVQIATVQSLVRRICYEEGGWIPTVSDYDLLVIDEAHRGYLLDRELGDAEVLYRNQEDFQSKYRRVIEYFDAVKVALTATPALHTTEIFGKPVYTYGYRTAVVDGYLVDFDAPHLIDTKLSHNGIQFYAGEVVPMYNQETGLIENSEELADELDFEIESFNRQVITEPFNRTVLQEIFLPEEPSEDNKGIDPEDRMQGKTLVFAVDDVHADLIVRILKEMYADIGVDEHCIQKITGSIENGNKKKILEKIRHFKNEAKPSIVVTVDLLTTGIDVREITRLVFLRRIKSRILYEQMLGRATRTCDEISKDHFEIYDAVGLYEALEPVSSMKPVAVNPTIAFEDLINGLQKLGTEEQKRSQIAVLAAKLQRRKRKMTDVQKDHFVALAGVTVEEFLEKVKQVEPSEAVKYIQERKAAFEAFHFYQHMPGKKVISEHKDALYSHTRGYGNAEKPEDYLEEFRNFVLTNKNEIAALTIICQRPKELTRAELKNLKLELHRHSFTEKKLNTAWKQMTNEDIAADIISFIRQQALGDTLISHEVKIKRAVATVKAKHPDLNAIQIKWLDRIQAQLLNEAILNRETFESDAFRNMGGFRKIDKAFGNRLNEFIEEINDALYQSA
ncbi:MAG: type I restriction-modification system endonuclease [Lachnospiraceae bacterium]|nr:type I restriction-modification system endonuclease [Lachnospiraceae bacterium]MCI9661841.1 type I restriction-modification system endonuclease [Lachnospiraceae bacterium]